VLKGTLWPFRIFLCYRREDSEAAARLLHTDLASKFGEEKVFFDVDANIPLASDFEQHISKFIGQSDALVAVIGKDWLEATDKKSGRRRLDNEDDYVRREIEMALERGVPVFQAYVQSADPPPESDLPKSLKPLVRLEGQPFTNRTWRHDSRKLIHHLKALRTRKYRFSRRWFVFLGVAVAAVLAAIALSWALTRDDGPDGSTTTPGGPTTSTLPFEDDFSSNEQGWRDVAEEQTGGSYAPGAYLIHAAAIVPQESNRVGVIVSPANAPTAENVQIDVEVVATDGSAVTNDHGYAYGIVCRASDDFGDLYRFTYWPREPGLHIQKRLNGAWTLLKERSISDVGEPTKLQATCVTTPEGTAELDFVVNDQRIKASDDEALGTGAFGLNALLGPDTPQGETLDMQFDDFAVNEVEAAKR
jgi:hypothetical protein